MDTNSKNITVAVQNFECRGRQSLPESTCQIFCESNRKWGSYGHKGTPYFKEAFL